MYPQFFGFDKLPFRLRPDPVFLYSGHEYLRSRVKLLTALRGDSRVVLLKGPPGVGKTLLLEDVLTEIAGHFALCRVNQPHVSATELLQALLLQLEAPPADANSILRSFKELAASLGPVAARGVAPLLIIDDAHLLAAGTLSGFEEILAQAPRLKILLALRSGHQPPVEAVVARMRMVEATGQIDLQPLSAEATKAYVERRLIVAGGGKEIFTADAHTMIFQHTGGAPRLINVLCDAALHAACMRASGHVSPAEVLIATQDSRWPEAMARDKVNQSTQLEAAPVALAQLLISYQSQQIAACPVAPGRISIGRAPDNELRLDARFISRHHCQIQTVGTVSTIEDLGSVNGVCVNGKVVKQHILQHEDQIGLGEHVLTYLVN